MLRPVFVLKVFILSIAINFVFLLHLLLRNTHHIQSSANGENDFYDTAKYYALHGYNPIATNIKVIPMPLFVLREQSTFLLTDSFRLISNRKPSKNLRHALIRYAKYISASTGLSTKVDLSASSSQDTLTIDCAAHTDHYPHLGEDESYILNVTTAGAHLSAPTLTGISRGLSTFVQLIERDASSEVSFLPCVSIVDKPRFAWRGLLLDVARHWMPVSVIERTLNAMELGKLNVLHLHLSDDQGFRVESVVYPLLHDRKEFFSQKDIRHLVEYAEERRIRLVPEFDIPGHTTSWFVGYPALATEQGQYQIGTQWGVMKATMDPTKEGTYTFLDRFFQEMTQLFPDPYFHIGGDEVEGSQWGQSMSIQKFITEHNLTDKNGLQAYFNRRVQPMLKKYGKIMIGWEEILEDVKSSSAIEKNAVIQAWKSRRALADAVEKGYQGLLSTGYYLDHLSVSTFHYKNDPVLTDEIWLFNDDRRKLFLGGEACMWSEFASQDTIDSRLWPRALAIAERFWSHASIIDPKSLYERLFRMNHLLDKMSTGVTHLSLYRSRLQELLVDENKKKELLHPFVILADACEPGGFDQRTQTRKYTALVPLTTFVDALQTESELVWKLENLPIDDKTFHDIFNQWSLNHIRLQVLFDGSNKMTDRFLWGQDLEQLSKNLAHVGQIGLRILNYGRKRVFHHDKNNTMNTWPIMSWILHHNQLLDQLENQVAEVRLAAVRPVRRLLNAVKVFV